MVGGDGENVANERGVRHRSHHAASLPRCARSTRNARILSAHHARTRGNTRAWHSLRTARVTHLCAAARIITSYRAHDTARASRHAINIT